MNTTVYKYPFAITDRQAILIHQSCEPGGCVPRVVHIGFDGSGQRCLWIEVDGESPPMPTTITIHGTGHSLDEYRGNHIGSIVEDGFVWHLYSNGLVKKP